MCYDASAVSFDATSPTDFHQGAVPLCIQCAFARNVIPYFSYPKTIYIVSWCDCSSVGGPTRHLSVPGTPQRGCRRLHQIFGQGKQPHTGERGRGEAQKESLSCAPADSTTEWVREKRGVGVESSGEQWRGRRVPQRCGQEDKI